MSLNGISGLSLKYILEISIFFHGNSQKMYLVQYEENLSFISEIHNPS